MARKVDEFPVGGRSNYPWGEWMDGGVWELTVGEDVKTNPRNFRVSANAQAKARGGKIRTKILKDEQGTERLYIQFFRP